MPGYFGCYRHADPGGLCDGGSIPLGICSLDDAPCLGILDTTATLAPEGFAMVGPYLSAFLSILRIFASALRKGDDPFLCVLFDMLTYRQSTHLLSLLCFFPSSRNQKRRQRPKGGLLSQGRKENSCSVSGRVDSGRSVGVWWGPCIANSRLTICVTGVSLSNNL